MLVGENSSTEASFDFCQDASSSVCLEIKQANAEKKGTQGFSTSSREEEQLCLQILSITHPSYSDLGQMDQKRSSLRD